MNKYNSIQYMNVYSKEYITSYTNVETCMSEFMELCQKNKLRSSGNFFYAIHQINEKADMRIEFFFPAKESTILPKSGLKFQSYYVVENMISVIVEDHFEENMEKAYAALIEYAEAKNLKIISPFYNEFFKTLNGGYYIVKAAINENE